MTRAPGSGTAGGTWWSRDSERRPETTIPLTKKSLPLALCAIPLFGVVACGGGADVRSEVSTTTTGQQLMDLKKALDSGAMTQKEYDQERKKILEKK